MSVVEITCIQCPVGCSLAVDVEAQTVTGNSCPRGKVYGLAEATRPERVVTALMRVAGSQEPVCVKTASAVPKDKVDEVLVAIAAQVVPGPVRIGDTLLPDVAGTGVDVVATRNVG